MVLFSTNLKFPVILLSFPQTSCVFGVADEDTGGMLVTYAFILR
jgi:hypothetical protein